MTDKKQQSIRLLIFLIIAVATILLIYKSSQQYKPRQSEKLSSINHPEIKLNNQEIYQHETRKPKQVCPRICNIRNVQKFSRCSKL